MFSSCPVRIVDARLSFDASARVSAFLRTCLGQQNESAAAFSAAAGNLVHPKTLLALLDPANKRRWSISNAEALVMFVSDALNFPFEATWDRLITDKPSGIPLLDEMPAVAYWHLNYRKARKLHYGLTHLQRGATRTPRVFARVPLTGLAPPALSAELIRALHGHHASETTLSGLRRFEKLRHASTLSGPAEVTMPESDFIRLLRREPPFHQCTLHAVQEFVEFLAHDWMNAASHTFRLLPDCSTPACRWLSQFAVVASYGDCVLLRRGFDQHTLMISEATGEDTASHVVLRHLAMLNAAIARVMPLMPATILKLAATHLR